METLRGNRKATTHLPVYRYGNISRLSGMNPQFMVSDHLCGLPTSVCHEHKNGRIGQGGAQLFS